MRTVKMTRSAGVRDAGQVCEVGNKTAAYLVDAEYAEYVGSDAFRAEPKKKRGRPRKKVDALTMDDLTGDQS